MANGLSGLCAGCAHQPDGGCGNYNASTGLGLSACLVQCSQAEASHLAPCTGIGTPDGLGREQQLFNFSGGLLRNLQGGRCLELQENGACGHGENEEG